MKTAAKKKAKKTVAKKDIAESYNHYKFFGKQQYTGMQVGRTHNWFYDKGAWKEKKVTPDQWELSFDVVKRRKGKAPEGSGVPVGTEYHWYILAHQYATKLNANDYMTSMKGVKFKIAHKRASADKWNLTEKGQRKKLIGFLKDFIEQLEKEAEEEKQKPVKVKKLPGVAKGKRKKAA
jgi:hypothetical protein